MKPVKIIVTLFLLLALASLVSALCENIFVNGDLIPSSQNNFVIPVSLKTESLKNETNSSIAFYNLSDNLLPFDIEYFNASYNSTHTYLTAWVKISELNSSTSFKLCYGGNISNLSNMTGTWSDYTAAYLMTGSSIINRANPSLNSPLGVFAGTPTTGIETPFGQGVNTINGYYRVTTNWMISTNQTWCGYVKPLNNETGTTYFLEWTSAGGHNRFFQMGNSIKWYTQATAQSVTLTTTNYAGEWQWRCLRYNSGSIIINLSKNFNFTGGTSQWDTASAGVAIGGYYFGDSGRANATFDSVFYLPSYKSDDWVITMNNALNNGNFLTYSEPLCDIDADCGFCEYCNPTGVCENQTATDNKNECSFCEYCGGTGSCTNQTYADVKTECGSCGYCDGTGSCINQTNTDIKTDCGLCEWCDGTGICENQTYGQDIKNECTNYYGCYNNASYNYYSGVCDVGSCESPLQNYVTNGNICINGTNYDVNPTVNNNCGIWSDCVIHNKIAPEYYVGYCSGTCCDNDWQSAGTTQNATQRYWWNITGKMDNCSQELIPIITYTLNSPTNGINGTNINLTLNLSIYSPIPINATFYQVTNNSCEYLTNTFLEVFDNSSVHLACDGAPIITVQDDLAWVIGHSSPSITTRPVGALYNLTTMERIQLRDFTDIGNGAETISELINLSNNISQPVWYVFYSLGGTLRYRKSSTTFMNLSFGSYSGLYSYQTSPNSPYILLYDNAYDDVWLIYEPVSGNISRGHFNRTNQSWSASETLMGGLGMTYYLGGGYADNQYLACYHYGASGGYNWVECINSSDGGKTWSQINIMNTSTSILLFGDSSGMVSFVQKDDIIVVKGIANMGGVDQAVFFTGNSINNLTFNSNLSYGADGIRYGGIKNGLKNKLYYSDTTWINTPIIADTQRGLFGEFICGLNNNMGTISNLTNGSTTSFVWSNLTDNETYSWFVELNNGGRTIITPLYSFTTEEMCSGDLDCLNGQVCSGGMCVTPLSYSTSCPAQTPLVGNAVNVTVDVNISSLVDINLTYGNISLGNYSGECILSGGPMNFSGICYVPFEYYYDPGVYDASVYVSGDHAGLSFQNSTFMPGLCTYNELLAVQRDRDTMTLSGSFIGQENVSADVPIKVSNAGNKNVTLIRITAYDLVGTVVPSKKIPAFAFRAGTNLGSSIQLEHGVQKSISIELVPGSNSSIDFSIWLSAPVDTYPQSYVTTTPWQLVLE
jgi:hypothetical protein